LNLRLDTIDAKKVMTFDLKVRSIIVERDVHFIEFLARK